MARSSRVTGAGWEHGRLAGSADGRPSLRSGGILDVRVDVTSYDGAVAAIARWITEPRGRYICVATVHTVMAAHDDSVFRSIVNQANLVTPDGTPLVWCLRLLGAPEARRVYGPALTEAVCAWAAGVGVPVGFYGSTESVLASMIDNLTARHPDLNVVYRHSPPFRPLQARERAAEIAAIRASGTRILFVGLGCPKQERWMADRLPELDVVMLGIGAAFDYLAGRLRYPPPMVQSVGLEWLFRLLMEPRRLWRRYLSHNPRFLCHFAAQLARGPRGGAS